MPEIRKGLCPKCGKPLEIPAELEVFSCLYCGERMPVTALCLQTEPETCSREDCRHLREKLAAAALNYPDYYQKLEKKDFFQAFEAYETESAETFALLDSCAPAEEQARAAWLHKICTELTDDIEADMQKDSRWEKKHRRAEVFFEHKVVLAIFMSAAMKKQGVCVAEPFSKTLNAVWLSRYPKEQWTPGDYDTLVGGFKKFKFCFITTATCMHEGKPDDCAELTAFRAFRDGWLRAQPQGEQLIRAYYELAPAVVACLEYCDDSAARYAEIRERWLAPCYRALTQERPEECFAYYTQMLSTLRERYFGEETRVKS